MPPKDTTPLNPSDIFIARGNGFEPLYPLEEVEEDPGWAEEWIKENPYLPQAMETVQAIANATLRIISDLMPTLIKMYDFTQRPDNKRLMHLARLSKKKRTRKKNLHRLLEKYKKENERRMI